MIDLKFQSFHNRTLSALLFIMKFNNLIGFVVVCLAMTISIYCVDGVKKEISKFLALVKKIKICKRYDPQIMKCICDNINILAPLLRNEIPEMNLLPIEPLRLEHIRLDLPETQSMQFQMDLKNFTLYDLSLITADNCTGIITDNKLQLFSKFKIPKLELSTNYEGRIHFLLFNFDAKGDLNETCSGVEIYPTLNATPYVKNGKVYLNATVEIEDLKIDKMQIRIKHMSGSNDKFIDNINKVFNANLELLYDEVKPVILRIIKNISLNIIDNLFETFNYDILFPKN